MGPATLGDIDKVFVKQITMHIVVGILAAILVGGVAISYLPEANIPTGYVKSLGPASDPAPIVMHSRQSIGTTTPILLTEIPFSTLSSWRVTREPYDWMYTHEFSNRMESNGVRINAQNTYLSLRRFMNLPLEGYESIDIDFTYGDISGQFYSTLNVSAELNPFQASQSDRLTLGSSSLFSNGSISTDAQHHLTIPDLQALRIQTTEWILRCEITLEIIIPLDAAFLIERLQVIGSTSEMVYATNFDILDASGADFRTNQYSNQILVIPTINISKSTLDFTMLRINDQNETIHLTTGNYSASAGWFDFHWYHKETEFYFELEQNQSMYHAITLSTYTLKIALSVNVPVININITYSEPDSSILAYSVYDFRSSGNSFPLTLVLPHLQASLRIEIKERFTSLGANSLLIEHQIPSSTPENLEVEVIFPLFVIANTAINIAQLFLIGFILVFALIQIALFQRSTHPHDWSFFRTDFRWFPLSLLILSLFLPWTEATVTYQYTAEEMNLTYILMAYGSLILVRTEGSVLVNIVNYYPAVWLLILGSVVPLYWASQRIKNTKPWKWDWRFFISITLPVLWASLIITITSELGSSSIQLGGILPFITPIAWIVIFSTHRIKRWNHKRRK
ncbi:MAG: hypothetical protein ACFFED_02255 [Candidatus Thorarchaeota archaeon]